MTSGARRAPESAPTLALRALPDAPIVCVRSFDGMYMNMAQGMGGIDPLMDSFFGFLRRKTDFFSGAASEGAAQEQVIKAFKKNKERADEDVREKAAKEKKRKEEERRERERHEAEQKKKKAAEDAAWAEKKRFQVLWLGSDT